MRIFAKANAQVSRDWKFSLTTCVLKRVLKPTSQLRHFCELYRGVRRPTTWVAGRVGGE